MFTYKFIGLDAADAETPYYYGSLPAKPELGHTLVFDETGNRYTVFSIKGEGLVDDGDGYDSQTALALAEIGRGEAVPTLWLQKLSTKEIRANGRSFSYEEMKMRSQANRGKRFEAHG
jgi:hypothetical protein